MKIALTLITIVFLLVSCENKNNNSDFKYPSQNKENYIDNSKQKLSLKQHSMEYNKLTGWYQYILLIDKEMLDTSILSEISRNLFIQKNQMGSVKLYDNENAANLSNKWEKNCEEYILNAEHCVYSYNTNDQIMELYPRIDAKYKKCGGKKNVFIENSLAILK